MTLPKAWVSWSIGKDSAWALHTIRKRQEVEVVALLTTVNASAARVAMHAVRLSLVDAQAAALGLPVVAVSIPSPCPNSAYERAIEEAMNRAHPEGVTHMVFGDLFLKDVRRYREERLARIGITPLFPLWGLDTRGLACEMVESGLRAYVTCVDPRKLDRSFAGRCSRRRSRWKWVRSWIGTASFSLTCCLLLTELWVDGHPSWAPAASAPWRDPCT